MFDRTTMDAIPDRYLEWSAALKQLDELAGIES
jgi:hypothetical protein